MGEKNIQNSVISVQTEKRKKGDGFALIYGEKFYFNSLFGIRRKGGVRKNYENLVG